MLVNFLYVPYVAVILTRVVHAAVSVHLRKHLSPTCECT